MSRDTRTPTSVTVVRGKYIVRVFDEAAYAANISQYGDNGKEKGGQSSPSTRKYIPYAKVKPAARWNWAGSFMQQSSQKRGA